MSARCMKTSLNAAAGHTISYTTKNGASPIDTMHYVLDAAGNIMAVYRNKKIEEQPIYGNARIGEYAGKEKEGYQTFNLRKYELTNHLGNVLAVISDKVNLYGHDNRLDSARATMVSARDYYPFGWPMKGRQFNEKNYRYGFNGMENDNEVNGEGNHLDYGARGRTPRLGGGWGAVEPLASKYPGISPYAFCLNNPIYFVDPDGNDVKPTSIAAYKAILNTLSAKDQSYVKIDKHGNIDKNLINRAKSISGNFTSLKTLVNDKTLTEVSVTNEYEYKNKEGAKHFGNVGVKYSNELDDAMKDTEGQFTKEQLKSSGFKDEIHGSGIFGLTILPNGEKDAFGDGQGSTNGNITVIISSDANERDAARTVSHEAYGHALFFIKGNNPNHGETKLSNIELENQIANSVKEAESNYDKNNKNKK